MKRLFLKYIFTLVLIITAISSFWLWGWYVWVESSLKKAFSAEASPAVTVLSRLLDGTPNRQQMETVLSAFSSNPAIVLTAVAQKEGKLVYARGPMKQKSIIWPLQVRYPLVSGGEIVGYLKVWLTPEYAFKEVVQGKRRLVIVTLLLWWGCIVVCTFVYLYYSLFVPLRKLKNFVDTLDRAEYPALDFGPQYREWNEMFVKLKCFNDKISDTNETMKMLFSVSQTLTSHVEINEVYNVILEIIQKKFPDLSCAISLLGDDGSLRVRGQRGFSPEFVHTLHVRPGEGLGGLAFQKAQVTMINDIAESDSPLAKLSLEKENIQSFAHIPLLVEAKCVGLLSAACQEKGTFTPARIETLSTLAKYLSIALRNAQLYERVQELNRRLETEVSITTKELIQTNSRLIHKVREMKALSDIAAFAAAKVNLQEILEMVVEKIKELLNAQGVGFLLCEKGSDEMTPCAPFFGMHDGDFSHLRFPLEQGQVLASVVREGKTLLVNDSRQAVDAVPALNSIIAVHSLLLVPLRSGKDSTGALCVANKFAAPFDQDDLRILELIADRVSGIIENVRLYQELERRLHDLTILQEISSAISSEPVWEETLKKVISATRQDFDADLCALLFYDEKHRELVTQPGAYFTGGDEAVLLRIPVDDPNSLSAQVFRSGEPFLSADASLDPRIKSQTSRLWEVRSMILVPLRAENRVIGVLRIGRHKANCYTNDHLRLASLIGHQAAIIIENAHLYESLREAKVELEQLNQIKNEFISMVSHELRTPLTAVKGFVKVVLAGDAGEINAQQGKFLKIADQSIDRLTILISDLLDISRIESGQMRLDLMALRAEDVVAHVVANMTPEIVKRKLHLETRLPERIPPVLADRERLIQVFDNLVLNAAKFTPENGFITVSAQDKGDIVIFSVADTGIGIDRKDHEKIFEKFYQVDSGTTRSKSGTGLGLAIVKSIVEMHGGRVWLESEPGKGATFYFSVPRAKTEIRDYRKEFEELRGGMEYPQA